MKRLLLFGMLGPAVGFLVVCAIDHRIATDILRSAVVTLPLTYAFDLGPLLICALIDFHLNRARWWERFAVVAFFGFVAEILLHLVVMGPAFTLLRTGLIGAVPAALCSWLVSITDEETREKDINAR